MLKANSEIRYWWLHEVNRFAKTIFSLPYFVKFIHANATNCDPHFVYLVNSKMPKNAPICLFYNNFRNLFYCDFCLQGQQNIYRTSSSVQWNSCSRINFDKLIWIFDCTQTSILLKTTPRQGSLFLIIFFLINPKIVTTQICNYSETRIIWIQSKEKTSLRWSHRPILKKSFTVFTFWTYLHLLLVSPYIHTTSNSTIDFKHVFVC